LKTDNRSHSLKFAAGFSLGLELCFFFCFWATNCTFPRIANNQPARSSKRLCVRFFLQILSLLPSALQPPGFSLAKESRVEGFSAVRVPRGGGPPYPTANPETGLPTRTWHAPLPRPTPPTTLANVRFDRERSGKVLATPFCVPSVAPPPPDLLEIT